MISLQFSHEDWRYCWGKVTFPIKVGGSILNRINGLREKITSNETYSREDNLQIFDDHCKNGPRYLFRAVDKKYGISKNILCDIGCAYGTNLIFCNHDSYGIEIDERKVNFITGLGFNVYKRDVVYESLDDLPRVEVIWCSEVLEHLDSPHIFLRKMYMLLKPGGILVLSVPTYPIFPLLRYIPWVGEYISSYKVDDHINAFVPKTLRFFCARSGFKTIEISPFYPGILSIFNKLPIANAILSKCVYIGEKIDGWDYPVKASRKAAPNENGFVFKR